MLQLVKDIVDIFDSSFFGNTLNKTNTYLIFPYHDLEFCDPFWGVVFSASTLLIELSFEVGISNLF